MIWLVHTALLAVVTAGVAYAAFWAIYVLMLPVIAAGRRRTGQATKPLAGREHWPSIVVIIPSHDMEAVIARCLKALQDCDYPDGRMEVLVVADHCADDTAKGAAVAGAQVLVRNEGPPGKTYTLAWTLAEFAKGNKRFDLYMVTDATARVTPTFMKAMATRWQQGEDIVVGHSIVDLANQQWFAQCLGLTLVHRNFQNAVRERLGLSSLIEGRGMAYSDTYIRRHGWSLALPTTEAAGTHPTEDWRHGVQAVKHGYRVAFAEDARVITPLRDSLSAATKQGVRWERGRMANAGSHATSLLREALASRNRLMTFAALDAIQPPVAILVAVCAVMALFGGAFAKDVPYARLATMLPLVMMVVYAAAVVVRGRREGIPIRTLLWAPIYVLWRCYSFVVAMASARSLNAAGDKGSASG